MIKYYTIDIDIEHPAPMPEVYNKCLNFDFTTPQTVCPLCGRKLSGATWKGPYDFYCQSEKLPDMVRAWSPSGKFLMNDSFLDHFRERGLTGITGTTICRIYYRKQLINTPYYIPNIAFSQKLISYAMTKNEERKTNKELPRCSLCMRLHSPAVDEIYFNQEKEFDIFRRYENLAKVWCTSEFRDLCLEMKIPGLVFRS